LGVLPRRGPARPEALTLADLSGIAARYAGRVVGDGHCVAFVREVCELPPTSHWRRGTHVLSAPPPPGTAVATFDEAGRYTSRTDGRSHAAVFVEPLQGGIRVYDQWRGRPVGSRVIRHKGGHGLPVDDGSQYCAVEVG